MTTCRRISAVWLGILGALVLAASLPGADSTYAPPANLGHGLGEITQWLHDSATMQLSRAARTSATVDHLQSNHPRARFDAAGRIVVDVILDGTAPASEVGRNLAALGLTVIAEHPATGTSGSAFGRVSAWMPADVATDAAATRGVHSVLLVRRPWHRVGKVTSQGVAALHADSVSALGFTGLGLRVGAISDSYNLTSPSATADIVSDDLPGTGNPAGRTTPVLVLQEGDPTDHTNTDEGRAMLQIVHDVAPDAKLAFSAVGPTQLTFVNSITNLRTNSTGPCDIIIDDTTFPDEPMFSDGIVAVAANNAVTSATLAGRPVIFYSAAGNDAGTGYEADWNPVSDASARATGISNLQLNQVPPSLTAGGFHNFAAASGQSGVVLLQRITVDLTGFPTGTTAEINFQWNDPFIPGGVTTDYCVLVFDASGNYRADLSGKDDNIATGEAVQLVDLPGGRNGAAVVYQVVISRRATGTGAAAHFRYLIDPGDTVTGTYVGRAVPTIFGHTAARNVEAVGAYYYGDLTRPELYSSFGPVSIYFDDSGNRLSTPERRTQPTISTVDGVDTSFFPTGPLTGTRGTDSDGDGYPNFFGTSAAAPHAAGVAALLLQAAGGPGSISPTQMRGLLESTAARFSTDPLILANGYSPSAGFGLVNALTALNTIKNNGFKTAPLINCSTRLRVETGDRVGIAGFVVTGTAPKTILVRGIGPSLTARGVTGAITNPQLTLYSGSQVLATNDNWQDSQSADIQATGQAPGDPRESAIWVTLNPGPYTAIVQGVGGEAGVALVEVFDLSPGPTARLINLATRGLVEGGENVMIAGFVIAPGESKTVLVRAIGPDLTQAGVADALADPALTLVDQNGIAVAANLHWADTQQQAIAATPFAPGDARDSAILITLTPGAYTAVVRSNSGGTGVALVEVYDLDR